MKPMRLILIIALLALACTAYAVPDFTFVHVTDVHAPSIQSKATISELLSLGEVNLEPYKTIAQTPSFVIVTGDLTEFGAGNGAWETYLGYWSEAQIPVYNQSGNHDGTW
jgi:3',5'-cyclic AMP phosphodiesterase CpdA